MQARPSMQRLLGLGLTTLAVVGCTRDQRDPGASQPTPATQPAPMATAPGPAPMAPSASATAPAPAADGEGLSGTVVETMDSGGYTYAKLDSGSAQVWVAGPETKLAVGAKIGKTSGTLMAGFRSNTLDRTFDEIYFISSFPIEGSAPANPHAGVEPAAATMIEKIAPAAGGQTIAELFAGKDKLAGKPVVVRGKVVKLNNGILGHNWLHIQDGTGTTGTNDLTITTDAMVTMGDVVVVRGTLATDKDFGGGYSYKVLIENATIAAK